MLEKLFKKCLHAKSSIPVLFLQAMVHIIAMFRSRGKVTVLIYHRVANEKITYDDFSVSVENFDWQMRLVSRVFNVISMDDLVSYLDGGSLPSRALVITFDDGYADNYTDALPVLSKYNLDATVYIAGDAIKDGRIWNEEVLHTVVNTQKHQLDLSFIGLKNASVESYDDKCETIRAVRKVLKNQKPDVRDEYLEQLYKEADVEPSERYMMSEEQLVALSESDRITIGCHTMRHPMLSYISTDKANKDIGQCLTYLEDLVKTPVTHFAYPYGKYGVDFHAEHVNCIANLPFKSAVTTDWGTNKASQSFYLIKRFTPWDTNLLHFFIRLCNNYY